MTFLFELFAALAIISAIMVIQSRNPIHSVLFLILVFLNVAALCVLVGLDFFAMVLCVVYVGAIAVLFLFVVMMLNIKWAEIHDQKLRYLPIGGLIGVLFLFEIFLVVDQDLWVSNFWIHETEYLQWSQAPVLGATNIEALGRLMYTYFFHDFLLASIILLVAMIGAIVLTMYRGFHVHAQDVFEQNTRDFSKTVLKRRVY